MQLYSRLYVQAVCTQLRQGLGRLVGIRTAVSLRPDPWEVLLKAVITARGRGAFDPFTVLLPNLLPAPGAADLHLTSAYVAPARHGLHQL